MRDQYIGIDLHEAFFQACAVSPTGERLWEGQFPRDPTGIQALQAQCTRHTALAVEASTPTWHFADGLVDAVAELRIVDPLKTKLKAGYAAKTDRLDARRLADALRRDSVVGIYYPPLAIRELRELCRARHALVQTRTALINRLRAMLLRQGVTDARRLARTSDDGWLMALALPPGRRPAWRRCVPCSPACAPKWLRRKPTSGRPRRRTPSPPNSSRSAESDQFWR